LDQGVPDTDHNKDHPGSATVEPHYHARKPGRLAQQRRVGPRSGAEPRGEAQDRRDRSSMSHGSLAIFGSKLGRIVLVRKRGFEGDGTARSSLLISLSCSAMFLNLGH
jgi:hypothetical protein